MAKPIACDMCYYADGVMTASVVPTVDFKLTVDPESKKVTFEYWPKGSQFSDEANRLESCEDHQGQVRHDVIGDFLATMTIADEYVKRSNDTWVEPVNDFQADEIDQDLDELAKDLEDGMDDDDKEALREHLEGSEDDPEGEGESDAADEETEDDEKAQERDKKEREAWLAEQEKIKANAPKEKVNPFAKKAVETPPAAPEVKPAGTKPPVKGATITQRPAGNGKGLSAAAKKRLTTERNDRIRVWARAHGFTPADKGRLDTVMVHKYEAANPEDVLPFSVDA